MLFTPERQRHLQRERGPEQVIPTVKWRQKDVKNCSELTFFHLNRTGEVQFCMVRWWFAPRWERLWVRAVILKGIPGRKRIHPLLCESSCRLTGPWEWIIIIFTKGEFLQLADLWSCKSEHSFSCLSEELLLRKCLLTEPVSVDPFAPYQFFPRLDRAGAVFSAQATGWC